MSGVPPAATLPNILCDLFQNEKYHDDGFQYKVLFSRVALTDAQKSQLIYPEGFHPLDFYIVYQTDKYNELGFVDYNIQLVSFVRKETDNHIYGIYFDVIAQPRFEPEMLVCSKHAVHLSEIARLITSQYIEAYNDVLGTSVILGFNSAEPYSASLQYSHQCRYFFEELNANGIINPNLSKTKLTGLSRNLRCN
jgi:hypothetical protein